MLFVFENTENSSQVITSLIYQIGTFYEILTPCEMQVEGVLK